MPKLLLREHSFLSKQSKCLSMTYHNIAKDSDINVDERDFGVATNLYIVPLHFLKVSERGFVKKHTEDDNNYHILSAEITNCRTFWPIFILAYFHFGLFSTLLSCYPYTLYTAQFQFTGHSLDLSDNVLHVWLFPHHYTY